MPTPKRSSYHGYQQALRLMGTTYGKTYPSTRSSAETVREWYKSLQQARGALPPESEPELFTEPIIGYRAWRVSADGDLLPVVRHQWNHGWHRWPARAQAPGQYGWSGLHAFYDLLHARIQCQYHLLGAIIAWGEIELHVHGFRAEYAQVVALAPGLSPKRWSAAWKLGVPCVSAHKLPELALRQGSPVDPFKGRKTT